MAKNKKKKKNSSLMVVLITLLSLTLVTFFVVVCAFFATLSDKKEEESYVGSGAINAMATEKVSVKINMENCTMKVGTKVQVTATVYPNGSTSGIIWASSDESVFTVDSKGNLEVLSPGIVALTANFGDAYDSIAIECVQEEEEAVLNLPDYSMFTVNGGNNTETNPNGQKATAGGNGASVPGQNGMEAGNGEKSSVTSASDTEKTSAQAETTSAVKPTSAPTSAPTTASTVSPTTATVKPTAAVTKTEAPTTTAYVIETTPPYEGEKILSTQIAGNLSGYGFKQYLDNTYVYEENDSYLGEVIISSNMVHIYIKERSDGLDGAVNSVLTELLPESHGNIWSIYTSASTDQTVTVDGRVVRVVVPGDGAHSQIVIYN